jgi:hypothetical protein
LGNPNILYRRNKLMKKLSVILVIFLLATVFSTAINFEMTAAAPKNHIQKESRITKPNTKSVRSTLEGNTLAPKPSVSSAPILPDESRSDNNSPSIEDEFTAVAGTVYAYRDSNVVVPIDFINVPADGISTANMTITYDPSKLEYVDTIAGEIVTNPSANFEENGAFDGKVRLLFLDFTMKKGYIKSDGVFAYLIFNIVGSPSGSTPITITNAAFGNKNWESVSATLINGKVDFADFPTPPTPTPTSSTTQTPTTTPTSSKTSNTLKLIAGKCDTMTSKTVTVPIEIENIPVGGISVIHTKIRYNPRVLEYIDTEAGSIIPNPTDNFSAYTSADGVINLTFIDFTNGNELITSSGIIANIQFRAKYSVTEIVFSNPNIYDYQFQPVDVSLENGYVNISTPLSKTVLSGYIAPDFIMTTSTEAKNKSGFKVQIEDTDLSGVTDDIGYFEIHDILPGTYNIIISKANYLTRQILNVTVDVDGTKLSTEKAPTLMWAGDIEINGVSDGSINMEDIMEVSKAFNSSKESSMYQKRLDLNLDGAINLEDIAIISKHFNKSSEDYN